MKKTIYTKQFKKDYSKLVKSGRYKIEKLDNVIKKLAFGEKLPQNFYEHGLSGEWDGCRDCHIEGDWVLIYEITKNNSVIFYRTGTHAELFG